MTTNDHDSDAPAGLDAKAELSPDAPEADALEQRLPLVAADEPGDELPLELPDAVDPADALDQAIEVSGQDDYASDPDFAGQ